MPACVLFKKEFGREQMEGNVWNIMALERNCIINYITQNQFLNAS